MSDLPAFDPSKWLNDSSPSPKPLDGNDALGYMLNVLRVVVLGGSFVSLRKTDEVLRRIAEDQGINLWDLPWAEDSINSHEQSRTSPNQP